ncbi:uncharacterized protein LOC144712626 [Wolffia australiana]
MIAPAIEGNRRAERIAYHRSTGSANVRTLLAATCNVANVQPHSLEGMTATCSSCQSKMWIQERKPTSSQRNPVFHLCCKDGEVTLSAFPNAPALLLALLEAFSFMSNGANFNGSLADNHDGMYTYDIQGCVYHQISTALLPLFQANNEEALHFVSTQEFKLRVGEPYVPDRGYDQPTCSEVVVVIPGDGNEGDGRRNIVLRKHGGGLRIVNQLYVNYDPLHFVLLFLYGSLGWSLQVKERGKVTMNQFYAYHFMWVHCNQVMLCASLYLGLIDQLAIDDVASPVERMITGSMRYMQGLYQNAMAIVQKMGRPDLFITMTCNPKWPEMMDALLPGQKELLHLIIDKEIFGKVKGCVYAIEFQKHGLRHTHMLCILDDLYKPKTPKDIDKIVCAELPYPNDKELLGCMSGKYLYKCVYNGHDCIQAKVSSMDAPRDSAIAGAAQNLRHAMNPNSIVVPNTMQKMYPSVYALQVRDENMSACTPLTEWMQYNWDHLVDEVAKRTLYYDFPPYYTWNDSTRWWSRRAKCYEDLRTIDGVVYDTYQRAAQARGLLHFDEEFDNDFRLASIIASPRQVCELFVMMLLYYDISQLDVLLEKYLDAMSEDICFTSDASQVTAAI